MLRRQMLRRIHRNDFADLTRIDPRDDSRTIGIERMTRPR